MTEDSEKAERTHDASTGPARSGKHTKSLAVEESEATRGMPTASSSPSSGGRHARQYTVEADQRPPAAVADATTVLPAQARSGSRTAREEAAADGAKKPKPQRKRRKAPWWELPLLVAVAILIAVLVKTFVVQPFYIPSESMEHTLYGCPGCKGDRILVNKPIYDLREPHAGDIVVFHAPPGWDDEPPSVPPSNPVMRTVRGFGQLVGFVPPDGLVLVKRVIATGGQTVKGVSANGRDKVMVSDHGSRGPWRTLNEPFTYYSADDTRAAFGPVTVPKGRLWVMGDHRNDSADSRFHCGSGATQGTAGARCDTNSSTVPVDDVIGKAVVIAWPPSRWRTLGTPSTFKHAAQALGGGLPVAGATAFALPLWLVRRRGRRRQ